MRPGLAKELDLRERLGRVKANPRKIPESDDDEDKIKWEGWDEYEDIVKEMKIRMHRDEDTVKDIPLRSLIKTDPKTGLDLYPHWLAQPYFRPLPASPHVTRQEGRQNINEGETVIASGMKRTHSYGDPPEGDSLEPVNPLLSIGNQSTEAKRARTLSCQS